ncbi:MAG: ABC transporter permease [Anaerolineae bacterium]|jgi:ABC-2 type transport system permease protein
MRKLWILARKELLLSFRDVGALVTMLVTPLALTLAIAAAFGSGGGDPLSGVPVLLLNQDDGQMGTTLVEVFTSDDLAGLVAVEQVENEAAGRGRVDADEVAALVIVPPDLTQRMMPGSQMIDSPDTDLERFRQGTLSTEEQEALAERFARSLAGAEESDPATIEIYASPDWRISTAVVRSIVARFIERANMLSQGTTLVMRELVTRAIDPADLTDGLSSDQQTRLFALGQGVFQRLEATAESDSTPVRLEVVSTTGRAFSWLDYSAASMAILFLMFTATSGGRTLLTEREGGTLPRLLVAPVRATTVLVGKMAGVVMTGILQVTILWIATSLIGAYWGDPLPVIVAIVALVISATGVGALVAAWSKTPGQANAIGTTVTLTAAALSGTFFPRMNLPQWVQKVSLFTPNAWGIEIFAALQSGDGIAAILPYLGWLALLTLGYYGVALVGFRRQFD